MSKFKEFGLDVLLIIATVILIPVFVLWFIAFHIIVGCMRVYEYCTLETDADVTKDWNELCDTLGNSCDWMKDLILDMKIES